MIGVGDLAAIQLITADHVPSKHPPGPSCMNRRAIIFWCPWIIFQISWYYRLLHCAAMWKKSTFSTSFVSISVSVCLSLSHTHAPIRIQPWTGHLNLVCRSWCIHWWRAHPGHLYKWIETSYYQDTVVMVHPLASCHSSCLRTAFLNCMRR